MSTYRLFVEGEEPKLYKVKYGCLLATDKARLYILHPLPLLMKAAIDVSAWLYWEELQVTSGMQVSVIGDHGMTILLSGDLIEGAAVSAASRNGLHERRRRKRCQQLWSTIPHCWVEPHCSTNNPIWSSRPPATSDACLLHPFDRWIVTFVSYDPSRVCSVRLVHTISALTL